MMAGSRCSTLCSAKPTVTSSSTARQRASSALSLMAALPSRRITAAARSGSCTKDLRNMKRAMMTNSTNSTTTIGLMWTMKSLKVSPARVPMIMLGGSPTRVAAPPMFDANASAIR